MNSEQSQANVEYLRVPHWPQDSIYTVLSRFALVNVLTNAKTELLFASRGWRPNTKTNLGGLETQAFVDNKAALQWLVDSRESLDAMFLRSYPQGRGGSFSPFLRYCKICMGGQRHFVFFQREQQGQCPFHGFPLQDRCLTCGKQVAYAWNAQLFAHPFCCPRCAAPLGIANGRIFYDVLTPRREVLLRRYSRDGSNSEFGGLIVQGSCPGFILTLPETSTDGWHDLDNIPLRELRSEQVNWVLANGYVQLRTMNRGRQPTEPLRIEHWDLLACLKSLLRHLKKTWGIRSLAQCPALGECSAGDYTTAASWMAYSNYLRFWASKITSDKSYEMNVSVQKGKADWLFTWMEVPEVIKWPPLERAWYIRHRFLEYVLDSLARCIETSSWSADVSEKFVNQFIEGTGRPIWPLEYVDEEGKTTYRIIRHRRFLSDSFTL